MNKNKFLALGIAVIGLSYYVTVFAAVITDENLTLGNSTSSSQQLNFKSGQKIKANNSTGKMQFSHDGTTFFDMGNGTTITSGAPTVDNTIVRYDGTTGNSIQGSSVVVSDVNAITGLTAATIDNLFLDGNTLSSSAGNLIFDPFATLVLDGMSWPTADSTSGYVLQTNGAGVTSWVKRGDTDGPASSTDNAVARFDLATGKLLQNSTVLISDTGAITGAASLAADNLEIGVVANTIASSNANGNILITPNGTGKVQIKGIFQPIADGTSGQAVVTDGAGQLSFATRGDVTGPGSSVDNTLPRFDSTTGKILQGSGVVVSDTNEMSAITSLTVDNINTNGNTISTTDTNGNLLLAPNGTGKVQIGTGYLLPSDSGTSGYVMTTDGIGGASWSPGGGGGGSSGINILENPDFETDVLDWTASGGTFVQETTDELVGGASASWTPSGAQTLTSDAVTIPTGLRQTNCEMSFYYTTTSSLYTAQVYDGTNVVASQALAAVTAATGKFVRMNFVCPSSGTLAFRLSASGAASEIILDQAKIGDASNIGNVAQASHYGALTWAKTTNCLWSQSADSYTTYPVDSDCPTPTAKGNASAPATKKPAITFANLPVGEFVIVGTGNFYSSGGSANSVGWRIHDGTTASDQEGQARSDVSNVWPTIEWRFSNTTARTNVTFDIQSKDLSAGAQDNYIDVRDGSFSIDVYYFPSAQSQVVDVNNGPFLIDAEITGSTISLSTGSVTLTEISDSTLTLTNTGPTAAGISCSSTNDNSVGALTCSAGSEVPGIVFDIPVAGYYEVCVAATRYSDVGGAGTNGGSEIALLIKEVTNATTTVIQHGPKLNNMNRNGGNFVRNLQTTAMSECGTLYFSSAGKKTIKTFYSHDPNGTITANQILFNGGKSNSGATSGAFRITVKPAISAHQVTVVDQIKVNGANMPFSDFSAIITGTGTPAITTEYGTWIDSITDNGTGDYVLNFTSGAFKAIPICSANAYPGFGRILSFASASTTSINVRVANDAGTPEDVVFMIRCTGPR